MTPSPVDLYLAALAAHEAGFCVVAARNDGSKRPVGETWTRWQERRAGLDLLRRWFLVEHLPGFGIVCGPVSGGAELLEWDEPGLFDAFCRRAQEWGIAHLVERVAAGYLEATPGGGMHTISRTEATAGNAKLAQRPKRPDEMRDPHDRWRTLIETRAKGGFGIVAPSGGTTHPSGRPYVLLRGGFASVASISADEREDLFTLARSFDQRPRSEVHARPPVAGTAMDGRRPGDDYDVRGDVLALLKRHGWAVVFERNGELYLRRPGKPHGISATFGYRGGRCFSPFTSSTAFEPDRGYSPFRVFAVLEHGGDFRAAARALAAQGFGCRSGRLLTVARPRGIRTREVRRG